MNNEKKVIFGIMVLSVISLLVILISLGSGIVDEDLEGELPASANVSISMANSPPTILSWTTPDENTLTPTIIDPWLPFACSTTTVVRNVGNNEEGVVVNVSDPNGDSDLNGAATVNINVSMGSVSRIGSCSLLAGSIDGDNEAQFSCSFTMQFYDLEGGWGVKISAQDDNGAAASNNYQTSNGGTTYPNFTYGSLADIDVADNNDPTTPLDTLEWINIQTESQDISSGNPEGTGSGAYVIITNCGNVQIDATNPYNVADSYIQVKGYDLNGSGFGDLMEPDTFSVDQISTFQGDANGPCNIGGYTGAQLLDNANPMAGIVDTPILDATLVVGPATTRSLYFCLEAINPSAYRGGSPIIVDSYSTSSTNPWEINACESSC